MTKLIATCILTFLSCSPISKLREKREVALASDKFRIVKMFYYKNYSICFLDSSSIDLDWHKDYKRYHMPSDEEIGWIMNRLNVSKKNGVVIKHFDKYVLQFSGYEAIDGTIKYVIGVVDPKYFVQREQVFEKKNIYYWLISNSDTKRAKYRNYGFIISKPDLYGEIQMRLIYR